MIAPPLRLLAISPLGGDSWKWFETLAAGGVDAILWRLPGRPDAEVLALARRSRQAPRRPRVLVHRRPDLATLAEADGLHLPSAGLAAGAARRLAGALLLGRSTHDPEEVAAAREDGLDYVLFGPVLPTPGKPVRSDGFRDLERAVSAARGLPVLALGGLRAADLERVAACGASGVAAIRAFLDGPVAEMVDAARRWFPLEATR